MFSHGPYFQLTFLFCLIFSNTSLILLQNFSPHPRSSFTIRIWPVSSVGYFEILGKLVEKSKKE